MALEGRWGEKPDCAVFADTGWEPRAVYAHLAKLEEAVAPFVIHRVSAGNIRDDATKGTGTNKATGNTRVAALPYFTEDASGKAGMAMRHCSGDYKLTPMSKLWRTLGATKAKPCEVWIGISTDEAHRMKPSRGVSVNRYPLIEANLSRYDCLEYLRERGWDVPKSSCIGCPFHSDAYWSELKKSDPESFADAVEFDKEIRTHPSMRAERFLHRSRIALGDIEEFRGEKQGSMFYDGREWGNECEGVCGT